MNLLLLEFLQGQFEALDLGIRLLHEGVEALFELALLRVGLISLLGVASAEMEEVAELGEDLFANGLFNVEEELSTGFGVLFPGFL